MINVIICDDNKKITDLIKTNIIKTLFSKQIEYKIHVFNCYNESFNRIAKSSLQNKFYILDVEVNDKSGIEIAKEIRKNDWNSAIVLLTAHYELEHLANHSKILLLDFISKFDSYKEKINESLDIYIKKIFKDDKVSFRCSGSTINLSYDEIIYIFYDKFLRKSIIVTNDEKYPVNISLKKIKAKLKQNFCYSHKSCIINKNYVKKINKKTKEITFSNDITVSFLSRKFLLEAK